jgi:signal transduction histidine kinase
MLENLFIKEIVYCTHDTFSERKSILFPAFIIYSIFTLLIYSYRIIHLGMESIIYFDLILQSSVFASFIFALLFSNKIRVNPILSVPSMAFIINSVLFLIHRSETNIYIQNLDWLFLQIIAIVLVSFTGSARCNVSIFTICILSPLIAKIFNGNINLASTYYEQSIIYFIAPITIYLSYARAVQSIRHINDLKKINELQKNNSLNKQIIQHQEKLATIGVLTASIAHEINNPLAVLIHSSSKLAETVDHSPIELDTLTKHIHKVEKSSERIQKIVGGLKTFSYKENQNKIFNFNHLLKDSLEFLEVIFKKSQIQLNTNISSIEAPIFGCEGKISQVITNLISNARDAIEESGKDKKMIRIESELIADHVVCRIQDTGSGIPTDIQDKIFEPFFSTKSKGQGLGLGMGITQSIIKEHHGDISFVTSSEGTTFTIKFPICKSL